MKIKIFHANAGYGHRKVAEIIYQGLLAKGLSPAEVTLEDALDDTPSFFRQSYPGLYFFTVKWLPAVWGWAYESLDIPWVSRLVTPLRRVFNSLHGKRLVERVIAENPQVIICTHFFSAELFARAKKQGRLKSFILTVITDFMPHAVWVNDGTDLYWVMGEEGKADLLRRGVPEKNIAAAGIPVDPAFLASGDRAGLQAKWNLDPRRFTVLLTSGSFGLGPTGALLEELKIFAARIQCFVVCGNNKVLEDQLKALKYPYPVHILGFVNFMPELMEVSDLMIAKSGGATTTESLVKGLPMVVLKPIPGQETRNADVLKQENASFFIQTPDQIRLVMKTILESPEILEEKRRVMARIARPAAASDLVRRVTELSDPGDPPAGGVLPS